ncbi:MAG: GDP-mannose 4,6-dehydratase [Candidatus Omnitrophica bacterium]|jgi:CDP-glucose 4,6-dehydratase|nr:GDP-mannose 4,6-dehydratase [Candidatus Omnitrophota bacterium]
MHDKSTKKHNIHFWQGRKVIITGHEGFLGSWLAKTLFYNGAKIIGIDKVVNRPGSVLNDVRKNIISIKGEITNLSLLKGIINRYKPQDIFHVGAEAIVGEALKNPVRGFKTNIEGTWNVLEAARGKKFIECIIVASSDKAYGIKDKLPYREDTSLAGCHPYDVSKSCADLLAYTYFYTYNLPVCVTRCGNIFGPGDLNFSRIIPEAIRSAILGKTLIIRSTGKYTRDYIYIKDIVKGYLLLAENINKLKLSGEAFNFSYENPLSVLELVETIYKLVGKKPKYKIINQAKHEIPHQYLSSQKARRILSWKPAYNLRRALLTTIQWYKEACLEKKI